MYLVSVVGDDYSALWPNHRKDSDAWYTAAQGWTIGSMDESMAGCLDGLGERIDVRVSKREMAVLIARKLGLSMVFFIVLLRMDGWLDGCIGEVDGLLDVCVGYLLDGDLLGLWRGLNARKLGLSALLWMVGWMYW